MTGGQRKAHVLMWLVLGPTAVIGLVLALQWRPPVPVQRGGLPGVSQPQPPADEAAADPGGTSGGGEVSP